MQNIVEILNKIKKVLKAKMKATQEPRSEEEFRKKFDTIRQRAIDLGINPEQLEDLDSLQDLRAVRKWETIALDLALPVLGVLIAIIGLFLVILLIQWPITREQVTRYWFDVYDRDLDMEPCLVELGDSLVDLARPPVNCDICKDIKSVDRVTKISPEIFEYRYAYSARPVVIEDAAKNWTAPKVFSFDFFKGIYSEDSPVLTSAAANCQFFPYKTSFRSLAEVFNMSADRAHMRDGSDPWYIGW